MNMVVSQTKTYFYKNLLINLCVGVFGGGGGGARNVY